LTQTSDVTIGEEYPATFLLHRIRRMFDGVIFGTVKLFETNRCKSSGDCASAGLVFRFVDLLNF